MGEETHPADATSCLSRRERKSRSGAQAAEADRLRSDALSAAGYLVLRFWNNDVLDNIDGVVSEIERTLAARAGRDG